MRLKFWAVAHPAGRQQREPKIGGVKRIPPAVTYTILRLLTFFVPLAILLLLGFNEWFSAIIAALIGFAVSLVFLRRSREQVATAIYRKRTGADEPTHDGSSDEDVEDDIVEHAEPIAGEGESIPGEDESMDAAEAASAQSTGEGVQGTSESAEADLIGDADTSAGETARAAAERDTDSK